MAATLAPLPSALLALGPPSLMMLFAPVAAATNSTPTAAKATRGAVTATKTANPAALSLQVWDTRYGMLHSALDADMAETPLEALLMSVLCGGGRSAAIAFRGAVLALSVPPPTTPFGLAQALGAMARTSAALAPAVATERVADAELRAQGRASVAKRCRAARQRHARIHATGATIIQRAWRRLVEWRVEAQLERARPHGGSLGAEEVEGGSDARVSVIARPTRLT